MSVTQGCLNLSVMHIRPAPPPGGPAYVPIQAVEAMFATAGLQPHVFPDVYRGLARLCSTDPCAVEVTLRWRAVIVCADNLGPAEFEFFSLVRRIHPDVPVYVYGMEHFESKIVKAIECGATGRVDDVVIRSLAATARPADSSEPADKAGEETAAMPPCKAQVCPDGSEAVEGERSAVDAIEPGGHEEIEAEAAGAHSTSSLADEDDSIAADCPEREGSDRSDAEDAAIGQARVPWLRYSDGPTRGAPKRTAPLSPTVPTPPTSGFEQEPRKTAEPLLSEEELQALLGGDSDDVAAIAPDEHPKPENDESAEGKGKA